MITMHMRFIFILYVSSVTGVPNWTSIGFVFEGNTTEKSLLTFVDEVTSLHRKNNVSDINYNVYEVSSDYLNISNKVCNLFQYGVAAIFGYSSRINSMFIQSLCDAVEIPFITIQWDPYQERGKSINLYPSSETLSEFYYILIKEMEWKHYTLLYDSTDSLIRMSTALTKYTSVNFQTTFRRISGNKDYRIILKEIKDSGEKNIVIDSSNDILEKLLHQALQVGIVSSEYNLLIISLDLQSIDLNPFQYSGVNMTGIRLVNKNNDVSTDNMIENTILTDQALLNDALSIFIDGFQRLKEATNAELKQVLCNNSESWEYGISLNNFIKAVEAKGVSGSISFDNSGFRSDFELEIFKVSYQGMKIIGKWNSTKSIQWIPDQIINLQSEFLSLQNTTFRVLIALTKPYGMLKETVSKMSGNDQYEGFAIDIIQEISKMLGFNYTFSVQTDNVYGSLNPETGQWNGMLRKIIDNEADLAITDLTITAERETAVDFTMPFMNLGISILYQKPKAAPPSLMSFLLPFSAKVWLYLIAVYLVMSVLFFIIGRISPDEWNNIYPCIEEPDELENQFTIQNSLWFCLGAIMQQGSEIAPIGNSTRMLAGCWWFFCLIMVSSYTANLAAFLTVETVEKPIKNAEDLANQDVIKYGAKKGGSTLGFFKDSNSSTYSKMYQYMMDNAKTVLTADNDEGKKKVLTENYAFLMESSSIEYIQERECNLTQIGGLLDQKGYGIAMRKNASYRNELSGAVLKLQEMGILTSLKNKWWQEKGGGGRCQEDSSGGQAEELGLANVGGIFLVLVVGITVSFFCTLMELLYNLLADKETEDSILTKLGKELKFIIKFGVSSKPVKIHDS